MTTITNAQIEALRSEAAQAGDMVQVAICDMALWAHPLRNSYRMECAQIIADAADRRANG